MADWAPAHGTWEEDLRSRLLCIAETTGWDRPPSERFDAIRGLCDLTQNGMHPIADGGQANTCRHDSATGVDTAPVGPEKVWRCDHCGMTWKQADR